MAPAAAPAGSAPATPRTSSRSSSGAAWAAAAGIRSGAAWAAVSGACPAGSEPGSAGCRGFRRARARTRRARAAGGAPRKKADPIEQVLRLTLEEMYYGVQKNLKLTRTVIRGGAEQRVSETLTIDVKPGWKKGRRSRSRRRATRRRA